MRFMILEICPKQENSFTSLLKPYKRTISPCFLSHKRPGILPFAPGLTAIVQDAIRKRDFFCPHLPNLLRSGCVVVVVVVVGCWLLVVVVVVVFVGCWLLLCLLVVGCSLLVVVVAAAAVVVVVGCWLLLWLLVVVVVDCCCCGC